MTMETDEQPIGKRPFQNTASTTTTGSGEHDNNDGTYTECVNEMGNKEATQVSIPPGEEANAVSDTVAEVFINHGLVRWEKSRREWLAPSSLSSPACSPSLSSVSYQKADSSHSQYTKNPAQAIPLDVDEIIDLIFSQRWRSPEEQERAHFPQPVPLPQMVDILVDLWEAEGLDI